MRDYPESVRDRVISALLISAEPSVRWKTRVRVLGENPRSRGIAQRAILTDWVAIWKKMGSP
jgi:hypothetical protein